MIPQACAGCGMTFYTESGLRLHQKREKYARVREGEPVEMTGKRVGPPTQHMIERVQELKDHELFDEYDWLLESIKHRGMLNTMGQAGILISAMKKKINVRSGHVLKPAYGTQRENVCLRSGMALQRGDNMKTCHLTLGYTTDDDGIWMWCQEHQAGECLMRSPSRLPGNCKTSQSLKKQELKARMYKCDACLAEPGLPCVTMRHRPGSRQPAGCHARILMQTGMRNCIMMNSKVNGVWCSFRKGNSKWNRWMSRHCRKHGMITVPNISIPKTLWSCLRNTTG